MSSKIWQQSRWTDLTHPPPAAYPAVEDVRARPEEAEAGCYPVLEIISEADCWTHLRASDRGTLGTGRRGVTAQISFSVIGGGLLACVDDTEDERRFSAGQELTLETSGPTAEDALWVVRASGTAQEPHPSIVGRTNFRRMDDLGVHAAYTFLYLPAARIRGFSQM